jgi:hypothetical protein
LREYHITPRPVSRHQAALVVPKSTQTVVRGSDSSKQGEAYSGSQPQQPVKSKEINARQSSVVGAFQDVYGRTLHIQEWGMLQTPQPVPFYSSVNVFPNQVSPLSSASAAHSAGNTSSVYLGSSHVVGTAVPMVTEDIVLPNNFLASGHDQLDASLELSPSSNGSQSTDDPRSFEESKESFTDAIQKMMYVSGETGEASAETTGMIEDIVRQQVIELVRISVLQGYEA